MTQATLPWIAQPPEKRSTLRRKAQFALAGLGVGSLVVAVVFYGMLSRGIADPRNLIKFLAVVGPVLGGTVILPVGLLRHSPVIAATGAVMAGIGAMNGAILSLTPIDPFVFGALLFVVGPAAGGASLLGAAVVVTFFEVFVHLMRMRYTALTLFVGGIVGVCLLVWAHALFFRYVDRLAADAAVNTPAVSAFDGALTVGELTSALPQRFQPAAYVLWPLQFALVRDLIAMGGVIGFISIIPLYAIWWERKVAGRIQSRLGPMRVGGWHGWSQSLADGLKLICKEDFIPKDGDAPLFRLAPYLAFVPAICAFIALPFAGTYVFRDLDVALIFILAMLGIEVVGVIVAGWASNNKWSVYGAMREACQMVSYEIPMGMSLLIPVMVAGALRLTDIADMQKGGFGAWLAWHNPWCFAAFLSYYVASLASCKRAPFDLPESESELVAGFHTEYSGFRWSLFFFAEYAAMFAVSGLATILFLGAWYGPLPMSWAPAGDGPVATIVRGVLFDGPIVFILKAGFLLYVQIWIRWTVPRIRIDQVLYSCIQVMLPLTMLVLLGNTIWMLFDTPAHPAFQSLADVCRTVLTLLGLLLAAAVFVLMLYGFLNKRRLVGTLAIDHLPGA